MRLLPKVEEVEGAELAAQISCRFTLTSRNLIIKSGKGREGGWVAILPGRILLGASAMISYLAN